MPVTTRAVLLALLALLPLTAAAPAAAQSDSEVVISEFRTRGPLGGNDEFVELRNRSAGPVDISRWQLQACASGTPGNHSTRETVDDDVTLAAGASYLFANTAAGGYSGAVAPDEEYGTGITDFAASNFAGVRIVDTTGTVRDGVGSPNSPCREGTGFTTPGSPNADHSFERLGGTTDTDNNLPDFQGPKPGNPQNSGGNTTGQPPVTGLRIHDIQGRQHFSPYRGSFAVEVPGIVTALRFNGFYFQDPDPDADERTSEGVFVFTGSAPPAAAAVGAGVLVNGRISEFRAGCTPTCTPPDFPSGNFGSSAFPNLSVTQIDRAVVVPGDTGSIAPTVVGAGGRVPPATVIDNDTPDPQPDDPPLVSGNVESKSGPPLDTATQDPTFDPDEDGIDLYESLEGMLTRVNDAVVIEPTNTFGSGLGQNSELAVLADDGAGASIRSPRGPIVVRSFDDELPHDYRFGDFNPERIILNDPVARDNDEAPAPEADVGDRFGGSIDAVVDYSFGNYKFLAREFPALEDGGLEPEKAPAAHRHALSVASYNVENLDPVNDAARIQRIARQIVENLRAPDILGVQEMQDLDGEGPGGPSGDATFEALVDAIAGQGGPEYEFRQIDPVHNQDGGAPNANIRVGFLFQADRVTFVDRPGGTAATATEDDPAQPGAQLTFSPGRIDPANPVWDESRKPLAGEFRFDGRTLFVVANHFASKGGDAPLFGRFQEPYRPSELQRRGQARVVNGWVERLLDADKHARVVVLGDLNDFEFSETLNVLERGAHGSGAELTGLWDLAPQDDHYSYIFQGNAQVLDHILVSEALWSPRPEFAPVHMNSEFSTEGQSDHDPPLARLRVTGALR